MIDWKTFGEEKQKFLDPDWLFNMVNLTLKLHGKRY